MKTNVSKTNTVQMTYPNQIPVVFNVETLEAAIKTAGITRSAANNADPDVIDAAFTAGTPNNDGIARSRSTNCGLKNLCQFVLGAMLITD
jgi:hypothetical protein